MNRQIDNRPIGRLQDNPLKKFADPDWTATGEPRAKVALTALETLWFNTGTLCNIECRNCYILSSPSNDALVYLTLAEVEGKRAALDEECGLGKVELASVVEGDGDRLQLGEVVLELVRDVDCAEEKEEKRRGGACQAVGLSVDSEWGKNAAARDALDQFCASSRIGSSRCEKRASEVLADKLLPDIFGLWREL